MPRRGDQWAARMAIFCASRTNWALSATQLLDPNNVTHPVESIPMIFAELTQSTFLIEKPRIGSESVALSGHRYLIPVLRPRTSRPTLLN